MVKTATGKRKQTTAVTKVTTSQKVQAPQKATPKLFRANCEKGASNDSDNDSDRDGDSETEKGGQTSTVMEREEIRIRRARKTALKWKRRTRQADIIAREIAEKIGFPANTQLHELPDRELVLWVVWNSHFETKENRPSKHLPGNYKAKCENPGEGQIKAPATIGGYRSAIAVHFQEHAKTVNGRAISADLALGLCEVIGGHATAWRVQAE